MKTEEIKELMKYFENTGIGRMRLKTGDFEIELRKNCESGEPATEICPAPVQQPPINVVVNSDQNKSQSPKDTINSPMVGTFYIAPGPGEAPFVKVGQTVRKGDVVGIIEAMKIMNEIEAEFDCRIVNILVADGQPVEFGMAIIEVEKL